MARGSDLTEFNRGQIHALRMFAEWSYSKISSTLQLPRSTVAKFCQRSLEGITHGNRKGRCGRKSCSTPRTDAMICRLSVKERFRTATDIHREIVNTAQMSVHTVRGRLRSAGMFARSPAKKTLLMPSHQQRRLAWARQRLPWGELQWSGVVFSDESHFQLSHQHHQYVRRVIGERYMRECVEAGVNRSMGNAMVWGCFSVSGFSELVLIRGRANSTAYVSLLRDHLLPIMPNLLPNGGHYQQDNAPIHVSRESMSWLRDHNISLLPWPAFSPDLNPVENVWGLMQRRLASVKPFPVDSQSLFQTLQTLWRDLLSDVNYRSNLIRSMHHRVSAVVRSRGLYTHY